MKKVAPLVVVVLVLAPLSYLLFRAPAAEDGPSSPPRAEPLPAPKRDPWLTSRVTGSPEPPPAYRTVRAFPHLKFQEPVVITHAPGCDRLFVVERQGKVYSFPSGTGSQPDLAIDLRRELPSIDPAGPSSGVGSAYGLTFHPDFARNRHCYVCYTLNSKMRGKPLPDGTRVSRFTVSSTDPPRLDPASEKIIITWVEGGHNGGCLKFGPDGYLYISTGDATSPNPPDALDVGQDMTSLLSSILRIDVDHPEAERAYRVPSDNPFVSLPGARGEKWAYGFRNPWKMSFDRQTGELWAGDVGWELWEMVYRIDRGGNYGWSVMEGPQPVRPNAKRGATPILPPALAYPHSKGASVTGGYVYRGKRLPGLVGHYIFGDWETRRLWAARSESGKLGAMVEIAEPAVRIVAFGEDRDGELFLLDYDDGSIQRIEPTEAKRQESPFPRRLSETGLFALVEEHRPAPGVIPFVINAEQWADHATAERFVALRGESSVRVNERPVQVPGSMFSRMLEFPPDAVLAKTLTLGGRRVETQMLHYDGKNWNGYSYRWNDEQTDADLVESEGAEQTFIVSDPAAPGGRRKQTWTFPGRAACARCHNPWAQHTLAFNLPQLQREQFEGRAQVHQLDWLYSLGILTDSPKRTPSTPRPRLTNPYDETADLNERARSYLQVNCAHCHRFGAGGTADIDLSYDTRLDKTKTLGARPVQGTFDIPDVQILAPGDPYRSVLFYRVSKLGRGRMPMIGSEICDERGQQLLHDWIRGLPSQAHFAALVEQLRVLKKGPARGLIVDQLLANTSAALMLARAVQEGRLPPEARGEVLARAMARPEAPVRDLFEPFLPEEQRVRRLGDRIDPAKLLALKGDPGRGRELFFNNATMQCRNCHRVGGAGGTVGPDLSEIGKKHNRALLLENILQPSKVMEPKYVAHLVVMLDGRTFIGHLVNEGATEIVLRDAQDKEYRLAKKDVEQRQEAKQSLMPESLLRDLTAEQAADLLAFLESLK